MGSFIAQHHVVEHGAGLAGLVLSSTSGSMGAMRAIGETINRAQIRLFGPAHRSALTEALSFKAFNRAFRPNRTGSDWLSRDPVEVDLYEADPHCGFRCSAALWAGLLQAGAGLTNPERLARIPTTLSVLLISGATDPVTQQGAGTHQLAASYRRAGLGDVTAIVYEGARHELLNETCREAVTADVLDWLAGHREAVAT
jgi:alpha-beta hydrolase superfamily lysophospholipase